MGWFTKHAVYLIHVLIIIQAAESLLSDPFTSESTASTITSEVTTPTEISTTNLPSPVIGENCTNGTSCIGNNSECKENKCQCQTGFFNLDNTTCLPEVGLGSNCSQTEACNVTFAVCNGRCVCQPGYYDDNGVNVTGGNCTAKVGLGSNCSKTDACNDTFAECNGTCVCQPEYYDDNGFNVTDGICTAKVGLGSNCSQTDACKDTNAECNGRCVCQPGYYDDNGVNVTGGNCTAKVVLGSKCPQPEACLTPHAECGISSTNETGVCVCREGYFDTNETGSSGECRNVTDLKVTGINYVTITEKFISITWNASVYPDAVNYYIVEHNSSVSNNTSQTVGKNTSATLSNLVPGQKYSIKITSVNTNTALSERSAYEEYYQISKPNTPGKLKENENISASTGNITLIWTDPEGVETGYTGFLENTTSLFEYNQSFRTSGTMLSHTFYGVKSGTWYNFTVQSISGYNDTATLYSEVHREPIKTRVQVPDPPDGIRCSDRTDTYIKLMWNAPVNPNGDLRHFIINVNRTGPEPAFAYNVTTTKADTEYDVVNLTEGSFYTFQIYTVNEQFQSASASEEQYCETRANMSEAPTNLSISNITSRSFTTSWSKPTNVQGELIGYILIISYAEGNQDCVVEEFINCSTGCKSAFPNQTVISPTCKENTGYQNIDKTELLSRRNFTSTFNPDTVYMVSVAAVNQGGKGHTNSTTATTMEEAPQKPYNISYLHMEATKTTIRWNINGPPPGKTNYTIIVTGDSPAENKTHTISGFSNTSFDITDLQEYWNYTLTVNASTIEGSNQSDPVTFKTNVAASGIVTKLSIAEGSGGDNYATAIVSWSLPGILERNGPIKGFIIQQEEIVNGTFSKIRTSNVTSVNDENHIYNTNFQVVREQLYRFKVFAYNGFDGDVSSMNFSASPVKPPSSVGALAGGIAGGVAALIVIVVIIVLWQRKRNNMEKASKLLDDASGSNMENLIKVRKERPISLANIAEFVADYHKDSNLKFSQEYDDLKTMSPQHSHEAADMEENRLKNRFVNILPFDHSRVRLLPIDDVPGSDYINANYLPGFTKTREYIACQGPIPATVDDHWRMIWEQNVRVIVMLTQYKEENRVKCEPYMPLDLKDPKQYGDLVVECLTYSSMNSFEYRTLKIRLGEKERTIKHFHFLSWRDYSANVQFDTMIDFIKTVRSFIQPPDMEGSMIVHCSAGVGRTGTYITIDYVIQHIDKYGPDSTVDIFNFVLKMRENRTTMVQTEQQYIFIHDCIKDYLDRFKTYENQGFSNEDENVYQNTDGTDLYQNMTFGSIQKTDL